MAWAKLNFHYRISPTDKTKKVKDKILKKESKIQENTIHLLLLKKPKRKVDNEDDNNDYQAVEIAGPFTDFYSFHMHKYFFSKKNL